MKIHVTCENILFHNYFSLRRRPSELMLFQRVETCLKLFLNYFAGLLQLMNIFQHVYCRLNVLKRFQNSFGDWNNFISVSDVVTCEITRWNNFEIISVFYFTCNHDIILEQKNQRIPRTALSDNVYEFPNRHRNWSSGVFCAASQSEVTFHRVTVNTIPTVTNADLHSPLHSVYIHRLNKTAVIARPPPSVIFVLVYFLVLVLVFQLFCRFSFVLVL